jgi:hypothetical protein
MPTYSAKPLASVSVISVLTNGFTVVVIFLILWVVYAGRVCLIRTYCWGVGVVTRCEKEGLAGSKS